MKVIHAVGAVIFSCFLLFLPSSAGEEGKKNPSVSPHDTAIRKKQEEKKTASGKAEMGRVTEEAKEIIVTATRTKKSVENVPSSATVVTEKDISRIRVQHADEAFSYVPGAYQRRSKGFMDTLARIQLRGFAGNERTLVMLDGQPLNTAYTAAVAWALIPEENIERIEVVKGPFSSLYGGYAMGGAINIITKLPETSRLIVKSGYGTGNTVTFHAGYADLYGGKTGFLFSWDRKLTAGYRSKYVVKSASAGAGTVPVTGWERTTDPEGNTVYLVGDVGENWWDEEKYYGKFTFTPAPGSRVSVALNIGEYDYGYDDPRTYLKDASGKPVTDGSVTFTDEGVAKKITIRPYHFLAGPGHKKVIQSSVAYEAAYGERFDLSASIGMNDERENWYVSTSSGATQQGGPGYLNTTPSRAWSGDVHATAWFGDRHVLTLGAGFRNDRVDSEKWTLTDWTDEESTDTLKQDTEGKARAWAVYIQDEFIVHEKCSLFLGARSDMWKTYDASSYDDVLGSTVKYDTQRSSYLSPKAGVVYTPRFSAGAWTLSAVRVCWGKAFRPPTVFELYKTWQSSWTGTTYEGNPDLDPETVDSWEVGIDQAIGEDVFLGLGYYENDIKDLIYSMSVDPTTVRKENAATAETRGWEASLKVNLPRSFALFANYTYQNARITDNPAEPDSEGKQVPYVPKRICNIGVLYSGRRVEGSLLYRRVSHIYRTSDNADTVEGVYRSFDAFAVMNLKLAWRVNENLRVSLSVDNLADKKYFQYYEAPGRSFFLEAAITW